MHTWSDHWNASEAEFLFSNSHVRFQIFVTADKVSIRKGEINISAREREKGSRVPGGLNNDIKWTQQMFAREGDLKKTNPNSCSCVCQHWHTAFSYIRFETAPHKYTEPSHSYTVYCPYIKE